MPAKKIEMSLDRIGRYSIGFIFGFFWLYAFFSGGLPIAGIIAFLISIYGLGYLTKRVPGKICEWCSREYKGSRSSRYCSKKCETEAKVK
jgi:hypothetical protein